MDPPSQPERRAASRPRRRFVDSVARLASANVVGQAAAVLAAPALSRLYTVEEIGVLALFVALANVCTVASTGRYDMAIHLPRTDAGAWQLVRLTFRISLAVAGVGALGAAVWGGEIARALGVPSAEGWLFLVPIGGLLAAWAATGLRWQARNDRYPDIARKDLTFLAGGAGLQIAAGVVAPSAIGLIVARLAALSLSLTQLFRTLPSDLRRMAGVRGGPGPLHAAGLHWRFPAFAAPAGLLGQSAKELPILLLAAYFSPQVLGAYALANRVCAQPMALVGQAVGHVFFERVSRARADAGRSRRLILRVAGALLLLGLPPALVLVLGSGPLFRWVFGPGWEQAGLFAALLTPRLVMRFVTTPVALSLHAFDRQHVVLLWNVVDMGVVAAALTVGGLREDPALAVLLFSVGGAVMQAICLGLCLRFAGAATAGRRQTRGAATYSDRTGRSGWPPDAAPQEATWSERAPIDRTSGPCPRRAGADPASTHIRGGSG